jgi:hypothetical protein
MSQSTLPEYSDYENPAALANDESLSVSERIRILECWVEDEEQLCIAASEGMTGGTESNLKAAQKALNSLL